MDDASDGSTWPDIVRWIPLDLGGILALVVATNVAAFAPVVRTTPLRALLGVLFLLFVPGYAIVAALFPGAGPPNGGADADDTTGTAPSVAGPGPGGIEGVERVAFSTAVSVAVVTAVAIGLALTPWGIDLVPLAVTLTAITLAGVVVAAGRRRALAPADRFQLRSGGGGPDAAGSTDEADSRTGTAVTVALVVIVVLAAGSVGYALVFPGFSERFSEFYVVSETDSGDLVADEHPRNFTAGEARSVHVGIENHEHDPVEYTVVVVVQSVQSRNGSTTVDTREEIDRYRTRLDHGERSLRQRSLAPTTTGDRLRLAFLLYKGDPPADSSLATADQALHFWVNVSADTDRSSRSIARPGPVPVAGVIRATPVADGGSSEPSRGRHHTRPGLRRR